MGLCFVFRFLLEIFLTYLAGTEVCPRKRYSGHLILLFGTLLVFHSALGSTNTSTTVSSTNSSKLSLKTTESVLPATVTNNTNNAIIFSTSSADNVTIGKSHKLKENVTTTSKVNVFVTSRRTKETTITSDRDNTENTVSVTRSTNNQRHVGSTVVDLLSTFTSGIETKTSTAETESSTKHHSSLAYFHSTEETTVTPDSFNANDKKSTPKNTTPLQTMFNVTTESSLNTVPMSNRISPETVTDDVGTDRSSHFKITDTLVFSSIQERTTPSSKFQRSSQEVSELRSTTITTEPPVTDGGHSSTHKESRVPQFSTETASNLPATTTYEATDASVSNTDSQNKETPTQLNRYETTITLDPSIINSSSINTRPPTETKVPETVDYNTKTRKAYTVSTAASTAVPTSKEPSPALLFPYSKDANYSATGSTTQDTSNEMSTTTDHSDGTPVTSNSLATDTEVPLTFNRSPSTIDNNELTTATSTYTITYTNAQQTSDDMSTTTDHNETTSVTPSATNQAVDSTTVLSSAIMGQLTDSSTHEERATGTSTESANPQTTSLNIKHLSTTNSPSTHWKTKTNLVTPDTSTAYTSESVSLTTSADAHSGATQGSLYSFTTTTDTTRSISSEASSESTILQKNATSQGGGSSTPIQNYTTDNVESTPKSVTHGVSQLSTYISKPSSTNTNPDSTYHPTFSQSKGTTAYQIPLTDNVSETRNASIKTPLLIPLTKSSSDSPTSASASIVSNAVSSSISNYQTMKVLSTGTSYTGQTNAHSSAERTSLSNKSKNPFTITESNTNEITSQSTESSKYSNIFTDTLVATDTPSQPSTSDVISTESTHAVLPSNTIETTVTPIMLKQTSESLISGMTESQQTTTPSMITATSKTSSTDANTFENSSSTSTHVKDNFFTGSSFTTVSDSSFTPSASGSISAVTTEPTTVSESLASSDFPSNTNRSATTLVKTSSSSDKFQPMTETTSFSGSSTKAAGVFSVTHESTIMETPQKLSTVTDILVSTTETTNTSNHTFSSKIAGSDSSTMASESTALNTQTIQTTENSQRITTVTDIPNFTEDLTTDSYIISPTTNMGNISSTVISNDYSTTDKWTEGMETQTKDAVTTVTSPPSLQETNTTSYSTKETSNKGKQITVTEIANTLYRSSKPIDVKHYTDMTTITKGTTDDILSGTPTSGTDLRNTTIVSRLNESHTSSSTFSEKTHLPNSYSEPSIALNSTTSPHGATTITEGPSLAESTLSTYIKDTINGTESTDSQTTVTTNHIKSSTDTPTTLKTAMPRHENFTVTSDHALAQTTESVTKMPPTLHITATLKGNVTHAHDNKTRALTTIIATTTESMVTSSTQARYGSTASEAVKPETTTGYLLSLSTSNTNGVPTSISSEALSTVSKISPNTGTSSELSSFTKESTTNFHISSFTETPNTVQKTSVGTNTATNVDLSTGKTLSVTPSTLRKCTTGTVTRSETSSNASLHPLARSTTPLTTLNSTLPTYTHTGTSKTDNGAASTKTSSHKPTSATKASVITILMSTHAPNKNASAITKPMSTLPLITNNSVTTNPTSTSPPNTNASLPSKPMPHTNYNFTTKLMSTSTQNKNTSVTITPTSTSTPNKNSSIATKPISTSTPNKNTSVTTKPISTSTLNTNDSATANSMFTSTRNTNVSVTTQPMSTSAQTSNASLATQPMPTSTPDTNVSVTSEPKSTSLLHSTLSTASTTITTPDTTLQTLVTMYPIVQPNPATAVYVFHFTMVIQGNFDENMNTNNSFKESVKTMLLTYVFEDVPGSSVDISFREDSSGMTACEIKSDVPMSGLLKKNETAADYLKISAKKVKTNKGKLSTPAGSVNADDLEKELADEAEIDQCENIRNSCDVFRDHVCPRGVPSGTCILKCDRDVGRCGQHGQCFFDTLANATACRCEQTSYTIYHGDRCSQSTRTMTYFLAMSLGIGGAILLVLVTIIVCMCFRMRRYDKSRNHSIYDTSDWEVPAHDVKLKDLSFRGSTRAEPFSGNYYRAYAFNDEPYQPVFGGGERRLFFPESGRGSTSTSKFDVIDDATVPSYSTIDVTADYSIRRPRISSRPYCDVSQQHTEVKRQMSIQLNTANNNPSASRQRYENVTQQITSHMHPDNAMQTFK